MGRERESYRPIIEDLLVFTGGKRMLTVSDVSRYTGRSRDWCRDKLGVRGDTGITVQALAIKLAALST